MTYRSKASKLVDSLINYTLDVKPYHTKLKIFVSELFFTDTVTVAIIDESFDPIIYLQNVWTKADVGALYLQNLAEGIERDRHLPLPPAVYSRFSLNSFLDYGQTPPGDDPASLSFEDSNTNGVPDSEEPITSPEEPATVVPSPPGPPPLRAANEVSQANHWSLSHQWGVTDEVPARFRTGFAQVIAVTTTPNGPGFDYTATLNVPVDTNWAGLFGIVTGTLTFIVNGLSFDGFEVTPGTWQVDVNGYFNNAPAFGEDANAIIYFLETTKIQAFATSGTGRYQVPFHHGSYVTVDGVRQVFAEDYVVDTSRGFIQFLDGKHPTGGESADQEIRINYLNSDRVFISLQDPLAHGPVDYDTYALVVNVSNPIGYDLSFINTQPNTTKATVDEVVIYPAGNNGDTWLMTASGFQTVTVQRIAPTVGPIEHARLNERFDNGLIAFTLKNSWLDYYFVQDVDSYIAYDISMFGLEHYGEPLDAADFWTSLDIKTEHGVLTDPTPPLHRPVEFIGVFQTRINAGYDIDPFDANGYDADPVSSEYLRPLGVIRQVIEPRLQGIENGVPMSEPSYEFYLNETPARGTYIEIRVEQARQYNPRVNATIKDSFAFVEVSPSTLGEGQLLGSGLIGSSMLG